jgi:hypothetical protein
LPDKPPHVLDISDALGRDVDRAREGKAAPPPMEAFFSDAALETMVPDDGPVHAEALAPISRAEAARRETFDGSALPGHPVTRRVIPAPFRRDRLVAGRHGKTWQEVRASGVRPGDIIPDIGVVTGISDEIRYMDRSEFPPAELAEIDALYPGGATGADGHPLTWGTKVAVGLDYTITGAGGNKLKTDAGTKVRVFR